MLSLASDMLSNRPSVLTVKTFWYITVTTLMSSTASMTILFACLRRAIFILTVRKLVLPNELFPTELIQI